MSAPPDWELLQAVAADLGVDPSFVEKDWHAIRLVAVVGSVEQSELKPVFSGGTSLSKGYGLIQRFSEDVDFKVRLPEANIKPAARRQYRSAVVTAIRGVADWTLEKADITPGDESRFFSCRVTYAAHFAVDPALRPHIRLEVTLASPALPAEHRRLCSFVAEARGEDPEVPAIACVTPVETAADKLSVLSWRVLTRERGGRGDDPALIRHLHDVAALEGHAAEHPGFPELLHQRIQEDTRRLGAFPGIAAMAPAERLSAALERLGADPEYPVEYNRFVGAMSYAGEGETPTFGSALEAARRLGERVF